MTIDIEQLRKDMEAGTPGPWLLRSAVRHCDIRVCAVGEIPIAEILIDEDETFAPEEYVAKANALRIVRVPDMEARILADAEALKAADELAGALACDVIYMPEIHKKAAAYRKARGTA